MNLTQALAVAKQAAQDQADYLNQDQRGDRAFVVHEVPSAECEPSYGTAFVVDYESTSDEGPTWETWATPMATTSPGVYAVWLRTYGGGRGDSQGVVYVAPGVSFNLD